MNVLLVYGGASPEHEVSIRSATTIYKALSANHEVSCAYITKQDEWYLVTQPGEEQEDVPLQFDQEVHVWEAGGREIPIQVVFPIVHGVGGEDGTLQTMLDGWGVAYVGTKAIASKLCFDKVATKATLRSNGIAVVDEIVAAKNDKYPSFSECVDRLGETLFVKPSRSGSSVGVHRVTDESMYDEALEDAFCYDDVVLIEPAVAQHRELEMAVLETEPEKFEVSVPGEIIADDEFYSYDAKYASSSQSKTVVNPELPDVLRTELREVSLKANELLECRGMVRVDFLRDGAAGVLYLNEVNTLPGFTSISMYPMLWERSGVSLDELVDTMVRVAHECSQ